MRQEDEAEHSLNWILERLAAGDSTPLEELDRQLSPALRKLCEQNCGPALSPDEVDEILGKTLADLAALKIAPTNPSARVAYFRRGRCNLKDRLRYNLAQKRDARRRVAISNSEVSDGQYSMADPRTPVDQLIDAESTRRARVTLERALISLSENQRRAVLARFRIDENWSIWLEQTTGKPAKYWRKASDDGLKKLRACLDRSASGDIELKSEYEFGGSRESA